MGLISQSEADHVRRGFENAIRNDGRLPLQFRSVILDTGILQQSSGSARCLLGSTEVLVSVKADIGVPFPEAPDLGSIECAVAFSPCAMKGQPGEIQADELGRLIERSLKWQHAGPGSALDLSELKIVSGKRCWVLQLDGLVLSADGNLLGALSIAAKAALADLRIPKIEVNMTEEGDEPELDLDDDPESAASLNTSRIPIILTVNQSGTTNVVDLTEEEELACPDSAVHVAVNAQGHLCGVSKSSSAPMSAGRLLDVLDAASDLAPVLHSAVDGHVQKLRQ